MTRSTEATPEVLGERDLVIVGAGPVGLAAAWYATQRGMASVTLDAGSGPLASFRHFTPGLVMASTAYEWEIDGLPVDCRNAREVTREDLFSYYGRVVALGKLAIAGGQRVVGVDPGGEGSPVRVEVETENGRGVWLAKDVLVTAWYRRRALDLGPSIHVPHAIADANVVGHEVVVVGGGISGLEVADLVIRAGGRVTLLARGALPLPADQAALFRASGSRVLSHVVRVSAVGPGRLAVEHEGSVSELACTIAFNCTGHEVNRPVLDVLRRADVLSRTEHDTLLDFRQMGLLDTRTPANVAAALPSLGDALWHGRRGVRFAGTIFHIGGIFGAGIRYSIETARWAVDAIAGERDDDAPAPGEHLPSWFFRMLTDNPGFPARGPRWSDALASVIPVPVPTWSRGVRVFEGEHAAKAERDLGVARDSHALGDALDEALTELRATCYDGLSVAELGAKHGIAREDLLSGLTELWFGNGLTWIPPGLHRA